MVLLFLVKSKGKIKGKRKRKGEGKRTLLGLYMRVSHPIFKKKFRNKFCGDWLLFFLYRISRIRVYVCGLSNLNIYGRLQI